MYRARLDTEPQVPIERLPAYWQEQIRKLRTENKNLRAERAQLRADLNHAPGGATYEATAR